MNRNDRLSLGVGRRRFLKIGMAFFGAAFPLVQSSHPAFAAAESAGDAAVLQQKFDRLLSDLLSRTRLLERLRAFRESQILFSPFAPGLERAPIRANPSTTTISSRATDLILACEVTSKAKYIRSYQRPTWPHGVSGVTIGIGYDVGYVTAAWLKDDWQRYVGDDQIQALSVACGATAERAQRLNSTLQSVVIGWDAAYQQFLKKVQPRWVGETEGDLPNTAALRSEDALGALVSLVYNRGPSFSTPYVPERDPLDRYREMRAIKAHMAAQDFEKIPAEIRSMKRIWRGNPDMRGLLDRRELEAVLFEAGLRARRVSSL